MKYEDLDFTEIRSDRRVEKFANVLRKRQRDLTVVLENIIDPHNMSACLRSCDAVGIYEVCLIYDGSQPTPKAKRSSSSSANKWIQIRKYFSVEDCFNDLKKEGKSIFTTHMSSDAKSLYDLDLTQPTALVFGNEHYGISEKALELADGNFLIPQIGMLQSLNISVACAVSVFEAYRQRTHVNGYDKCQFEELEFKETLNTWLSK